MIEYYDLLNEEEQDDMRDLIQLLLRQTFLLERKYDRRAGRMVPVREYRFADRHLDFLAHRLDDRRRVFYRVLRNRALGEASCGCIDAHNGTNDIECFIAHADLVELSNRKHEIPPDGGISCFIRLSHISS